MASDSFVHLHVHSEYSMLDGAARVKPLIEEASKQGMPAIAVTDHGNTFGAFDFYKTATDTGIKPIIGMEAYVTPGTHRADKARVRWGSPDQNDDDVSGSGAYTHMTLLAESNEGLHNLFRMSSYASLEGYYFKPRLDRELLQTYAKGVIATTGCVGGEVQTRLRLGQYDAAKAAAAEFRDIFGKDNFYAEVMDHGIDIERRTMNDLMRLAKELDLPLVATNDLHYTHQHDAKSHAALLCVQSGSTLDDPKRFKFEGEEFYLKTPAQMRHIFRDNPEACDNTLAIAERVDIRFDTSANYMPRYPVPAGETEQSWFVKEVERGLHVRYPAGIPTAVRERADFETDVIVQMGFPGYFLVVADFINWAKENGIRVGPGRGSGAGSMAAYAMRITDLDPLQHGLLFERFLNPDRVSMPDFDIDFDDRRRGEVIQYVTEKYGDERVAQIVTYGTIKAKQALKDASRVLGFPFGMGERLTKAMPPAVMGKDMPLEGMFDPQHPRYKEASEFRALIDTDPEAKTVFDTAVGLENLKRQWGVHAAGVIMSSEPLIDIIPIMKREQDGQIVTQFDYPACESLGLIKMDFLGLRNLTIIDDALDNIRANRDEELVLEDLALDDAASYELLARGDTLGVFQLDGGPMRSLLRLMKPDNFEDISAVLALYRPGPMGVNSHTNYALRKNGLQEIEPIHPELAEPLVGRARHDLRPHRLPGAGDGGGAEAGRLHARAGRHPAPRDGQEEEVRARQAAGRLLRRHDDQRLQPAGAGGALEGARVVRRLRLQQGAHGRLRTHRLLDGVPQGALPRRVHGGAADERRRREGQARRLPQRVPPHGHQGAPAGCRAVDQVLRRRRRRHPLRSRSRPQRRLQRRRGNRRLPRRERLRVVPRLPHQGADARREQAHGRVAHQGRSVRLPRRHAPRAHGDPRGRHRAGGARQAPRGQRRGRLRLRQPVGRADADARRCPIDPSGRRRTSSRSSARCSASTSRITRWRGSRWRSRSTRRRRSTTC